MHFSGHLSLLLLTLPQPTLTEEPNVQLPGLVSMTSRNRLHVWKSITAAFLMVDPAVGLSSRRFQYQFMSVRGSINPHIVEPTLCLAIALDYSIATYENGTILK